MATRLVVAICMVLAGGTTLAQDRFSKVEVRAETEESLSISCRSPELPALEDVERVLQLGDASQAAGLRKKLMGAASEACKAGEGRIQVMRTGTGDGLAWKALSAS